MLPRIQWFEFNELSWMPAAIRHAITRTIGFDQYFQGCFRGELSKRFARWLDRTGTLAVLDIGSGHASPILSLIHGLRQEGIEPPRFHLSDLCPDLARYAAISQRAPVWTDDDSHFITFAEAPVDAFADPLPCEQDCFTLINLAHHFPPPRLKRILANLTQQGRGVFIIETIYRSVRFFPLMLASLVPSWLAPLFVRPFRWSHLALGTLLPLTPLLVMHDGMATILRNYTVAEWRALVSELPAPGYEWEIDLLPTGTVYVAGWRR